MPAFRARAVIQAFRTGSDTPPDWFTKAVHAGRVRMLPGEEALIELDEGTELASKGDYIIHDAAGEILSMPADDFEAIYEAV